MPVADLEAMRILCYTPPTTFKLFTEPWTRVGGALFQIPLCVGSVLSRRS